ncbi:hypothetical protein CPB85DRAFT_1566537 [Mucidula mucida]|nr:hypothetical protein CPB85DRAFT_1566537 [Mucidula mucida]
MERDFFATSGIVTNERCGNPECLREGELPLLRRCGGCLHVLYCSRLYQKKDWTSGHPRYCTDRVRDRNFGRLYTTNISTKSYGSPALTGSCGRNYTSCRLIQTGTSSLLLISRRAPFAGIPSQYVLITGISRTRRSRGRCFADAWRMCFEWTSFPCCFLCL